MSESLLDQAIDTCHDALSRMSDAAPNRELLVRLTLLERAYKNVRLEGAERGDLVQLATVLLRLRDEVLDALLQERRSRVTAFAEDAIEHMSMT
jgi:hypothetical protein